MIVILSLQGSHGHGKSRSWKMKYRPRKVMENENLAKSHGKGIEFLFFHKYPSHLFEKNVFITYTLLTHNETDTAPNCKIFYM